MAARPEPPQDNDTAELWWCSRCPRVAQRVLEVRYSVGLVDHSPEIRCEACVEELREEERSHQSGLGGSAVWAIEIVRVFGESSRPIDSLPTRPLKRQRKPRRGAVLV